MTDAAAAFDPVFDPVLDTAIDTRSLVEASAGTGKTFALAGMFARAVIVERFRVPQVLAVTYTDKATQELHERIRARLGDAAALAATWQPGDGATHEGDDAGTAMLRRLLHAALADESRDALRLRLGRALRDMDLAAISTIHGFCQRVLREHALDTGQALVAAEIEPGNAAQRAHLAVDLWRLFSDDAEGAGFLRRHFGSPETLTAALRALLAYESLLPPAPQSLPEDPRAELARAWQALASAFAAHGAQVRTALSDAIANGVLKASEYKPEHVTSLWLWFDTTTRAPAVPGEPHPKLHKYVPQVLAKGTCKAKAGQTPLSPLFDAVPPLFDALNKLQAWRGVCDLKRLHDVRDQARQRDHQRKRDFNTCDYDDLIGRLHDAVRDERTRPILVLALRAQFPRVLVDEFQDTDARQWEIFATLFGNGSLVLVGDPKQAIYRFRGGDVNTYVAAANTAGKGSQLDRNFRSRPCVIAAVNTLFANAPPASLGAGIEFLPTKAGGKVADSDFVIAGAAAPGLQFHVVPQTTDRRNGQPKDWTKPESVRIASNLCADAIRERLQQARDGRALCKDKHSQQMRPLQPRDFAVLVREHAQATAVREALARRGVPAVASGKESLYQGDEAQDLLALLLALRTPGDDRRLRAALATPLLGWDAARIAALGEDGEALRGWQQTLADWRARWERHGPQAMLAEVVVGNAARLLALVGGERRLTNYLQLGELMQASGARSLGTQGQLEQLRASMAHADAENEAQQPRLESDAGRVQILTLHKSKGLEFPLVYLPFVAIGRQPKVNGMAMYTQADGQRVRQWPTADALVGDGLNWDQAKQQHLREECDEDMRLLYVGLTRARDALWVCCGGLAQNSHSALHTLLHAAVPGAALLAQLGADVDSGLPRAAPVRLGPVDPVAVPPARNAQRHLHRDWWIHSFSQLHRQQAQGAHVLVEDSAAGDERVTAAAAMPRGNQPIASRRFGGTRFGNVLHHALEHADFAAWRDHAGDAPPATQHDILVAALDSQGYAARLHAEGIRELVPLMAGTLNAQLPEGLRLCDQPPAARIVELEFHFALRGASTQTLLGLLHTHGIALGRRDFGAWAQLSGLMNGKIDLTYRHDGRMYVVDYKSNLLPAYDQATLAQVMAASEYDLQALLYVVAVHRWLRLRLGADYDFDLHFGGVRYLFCRGLRAGDTAAGVSVPRFARALVEAVDGLLAPSMEVTA